MATNHEELLDSIGNMTVLELSEFVDAFKDKFNVTAMVAPAAMPVAPGADADAAEEQHEFDVVLDGIGDKKIQVIKVVRELTKLGLKEAKAVVDDAPGPVLSGVDKETAEKAKAALEGAGASVEIK